MGGIWIRSQDKQVLVCVNKITYSEYGVFLEHGNYIIAGDTVVGKYASQKRALQVLDEIEQFIVDCEHCKDDKMFYPVFQMPAE